MRHLNRSQFADTNGNTAFFFFDVLIFKLNNTPDSTAEQTVKLTGIVLRNRNVFYTKIGKLCLINIFSDVQTNRDFVNHGVTAILTEYRENLLCFIRTDIVVREDVLDIRNALFNNFLIVTAAILSK